MADLAIVAILALAAPPLALLTDGPLRVALGLLFVLLAPGYSLVAALFPGRKQLEGVERLALSLGLSIAVVPLLGLALNYTPWGIRPLPVLLSLAILILALVAIAAWRRRRLPSDERFHLRVGRPRLAMISGQGRLDRALTVALAIAVLGAVGSLAYVVATPKVGERFTEFYVLGTDGKAEGYPRDVKVGDDVRVTLGVVNDEHETSTYRVAIVIDGEQVKELGPLVLADGERWEEQVSFQPRAVGSQRKVEFRLFKGEGADPYRTLHLWLNVAER